MEVNHSIRSETITVFNTNILTVCGRKHENLSETTVLFAFGRYG